MRDHRVKGQPLPASGEDVLADPRWEVLASGGATPEEVASLRAWAERSTAARAAWEMFQPVDDVRSDGLAAGVLRVLRERDAKARDVRDDGPLLGGRYRLSKRLQRGAMTSRWEAEDTVSGQIVAIKGPTWWEPRAGEEHPLMREAKVLACVPHPNILSLLHVGTTAEGAPFLVMPGLHGKLLSKLLKSKERLGPALAVRIAREVASALAALHEARFVHGALHPSNIFLHRGAARNLVSLVDLDVCKDLGESRAVVEPVMAGAKIGSIPHPSPEQIRGQRDLDERSDVWSLGILLYRMLTGTRPFPGSMIEVFASILTRRVPSPSSTYPDVPPLLDAFVQRCTAMKREERIQSAAEAQVSLSTIETELSMDLAEHSDAPRQCPHCGFPNAPIDPHCGMCDSRLGPSPLEFILRSGRARLIQASDSHIEGFAAGGVSLGPLPASTSWPTPSSEMTPRRALAGFLVSDEGDPNGKLWPLYQGQNMIGRADTGQQVDVEIPHDTVDTHHATIECEDGRFILTDLGSKNGTFHNDEAIGSNGRREIRDGDEIRFGGLSVIARIVVSVWVSSQ